MKTDFHKGTYSQDVETLTPGEEYFSVRAIPAVVIYVNETAMIC
ncbi:hypothetical protein [Lacibacter sp. H407]